MKRSDVEDEDATYAYIYIPKAADAPSVRVGASDIARGSAIIGLPDKQELIWYEGNIYGAVNLKRYGERVRHAAGRAFTKSYSAFTGGFDVNDFHQIGTISRDYAIFLDSDMDEIAQWSMETVEEIRQENRDFLATRAYNSGDAHKMRRLRSCLTCAGTQELQKEKTSHRIFCNTDCQRVFYVSNRLINLNVGPDEAGPKINDPDTIGIITTGFNPNTEKRKFRISLAEAEQMTTISNWLNAAKDNRDKYYEIPVDGRGFAMLIDALCGNFPVNEIRELNDDDLYSLAKTAAFTSADTFLWSTLLRILGQRLLSFADFDRYNDLIPNSIDKSRVDGFFKILKHLIIDIVYTFSHYDLKKFVHLLTQETIQKISFPFKFRIIHAAYFDLDYDTFRYFFDIWNVISAASTGNLTLLQKLQAYHFEWNAAPKDLTSVWTMSLIEAITNSHINIVQYLTVEDVRTVNVIDFIAAFNATVKMIGKTEEFDALSNSKNPRFEILDFLLQNPHITVVVKYQTLVNQMPYISHLAANLILSDKRIDPSINNQEIFKAAIDHLKFAIVKILLQDKRIDPGANNDYALRSVVAKKKEHAHVATNLAILLIKDSRVNPNVIPERYKDGLIDALRERYTRDADAAEEPKEKKPRIVNFRLY